MATACCVCMLLFLKKHRQEPVAGEILLLELATTIVLLNGYSAPLPPNACPYTHRSAPLAPRQSIFFRRSWRLLQKATASQYTEIK